MENLQTLPLPPRKNMTKQYVIFLAFLLLVSNTVKTMETSTANDRSLEEQFQRILKNKPVHTDAHEFFNGFIAQQAYLLLDDPDNIEKLNAQVKKSCNPLPNQTNRYKIDRELQTRIERSKKKHKELFDFVKKYQDVYRVDPQIHEDLKALEQFIEPIQSTIGIYHDGKSLTLEEYFAQTNLDPAERDDVKIAAFEQTANIRWAFDNLPSEQAIEALPSAIQKFKTLQNYYTQFIHTYPDHEQRAEYERKLACSQKLFETFPPEYLKEKPSKKEIERISVRSFFRGIDYYKIQEKFDSVLKSQNPEEQEQGLQEILGTAQKIEAYTEKYPTLDPEFSGVLHKASKRIFEVLGNPSSDE